jgi:hypothetical protein
MNDAAASAEAVEMGEVVLHTNNLSIDVSSGTKEGEILRSASHGHDHKGDSISNHDSEPGGAQTGFQDAQGLFNRAQSKELGLLLDSQEGDAEHSNCAWLLKCCFEKWPLFMALCVLVAAGVCVCVCV